MAQWVSPGDAPSNVRVTVVPGPRAHPVRDRSAAIRGAVGLSLVVASIVLVAAAGAIVGVAVGGGRPLRTAPVHVAGAPARATPASVLATEGRTAGTAAAVPATEAGKAGLATVAAAYRYPLGCLGITISADRSAMLGRHSPCWRYGVYVTAVLRQVNGVWRLMLKATSPKCPAVPLPEFVRSALITCERSAAPGSSG
jgi:hypothetical protein